MTENIIAAMRVAAALEGKLLSDETIARARRVLEGDPIAKEARQELAAKYNREAQISYVPTTAEHITYVPVSADSITGKCWRHNYVSKVVLGNDVTRCTICKKRKGY